MSKQSFPDAYIGAGKRSGKGSGLERWNIERAQSIDRREKYLEELNQSNRPVKRITYHARAENQCYLSLLYAWEGRAEPAKQQMEGCLATICDYFRQYWPDVDPANTYWFAQKGAIAAALLNQQDLARTLFTRAAHLSAGLVTGQEVNPLGRTEAVSFVIEDALAQAYSQLRLGQLSGFRANLYPVGFPEAKNQPPELRVGDVGDVLQTIDTAIEVGRAKREDTGLMWNHIKFQIPVLRTLYAYFQTSNEETAGQARKALTKYYEMIRSLADFPVIYLHVFDLQKAYPQVYADITPSVFT